MAILQEQPNNFSDIVGVAATGPSANWFLDFVISGHLVRQLAIFIILAYMKTLENFLNFATCIISTILASFFIFSNKSQERKKSQLSRIVRVIQNHNPETEKDQKNISNFGRSSQELNRAVSSFLPFICCCCPRLLLSERSPNQKRQKSPDKLRM